MKHETSAGNAELPRAVVLGGGIVGSSAAYTLAGDGFDVTLVDSEDQGMATAAGAGIVAPAASLGRPHAWYPLAFAGADFYLRLVARLRGDGISDVGYDAPPLLFLALGDAERERLGEVEEVFRERKAAGAPGLRELTRLEEEEVRGLFPPVAAGCGAIYLSGAARVNGSVMRAALQEGVRRRGAAIVRGRGRLRESKRRRWSVELEDDGARLDADVVVCATGAWTYAWADDAGATPAVYPQRGQILHLELPATSTGDWPMIIGFGSHYMLTFPESRVVAGATREDQAGWDYRVTAAGQLELLREAFRVAPGLLDATLVETRVGFRPATRDGMPLLGRAPGIENGVIATGLGPSGLTLGPYIGHLAAGLAAGREPPLDISAFDPGRHLGV